MTSLLAIHDRLANLAEREATCWQMAKMFLDQRDPHGLHDIGVEIEGLRRAQAELKELLA
jgi:hypothetical protein